uniref:Odorant-binding protein OBP2.3 n=1 Tax=Lobesia botrana TaxID=209534 RepID=A0A345BEP9_9NEOP|nr:odorant-binding protein OBP2.3 [Lobesia botrana]
MLGIDTSHNVKIDKDTIITRNLNLESRKKGKTAHQKQVEEAEAEPDWSYNAIPSDVAPHAQQFKQNMSECLKEVQANDKRPVKRLSPKTESPVNGECLIACVLKRSQVIDNGKINKANLISLVSKFYAKDTKMIKKLDKNLDRCIEMSANIRDECHLA